MLLPLRGQNLLSWNHKDINKAERSGHRVGKSVEPTWKQPQVQRPLHTPYLLFVKKLMIRTLESQTQVWCTFLSCFPDSITATRGKRPAACWPDCSHAVNCSILSSTEFMARAISRTGLKRMGLTLLLIIIYNFVSIWIIVACSDHICKQAVKIVSKEMVQIHVNIFTLRIQCPMSAWRIYRSQTDP